MSKYAGPSTDRMDCRIRHRAVGPRQVRVGHDRIHALLILLIESGALYCCIWSACLSTWKYGESKNLGLAFEIFDSSLSQLGIYPTLIIVLCSLQRSYHHDTVMAPNCASLPMAAPRYSSERCDTHGRAEDALVATKDSDTQDSRSVSDVKSAMMFYAAPSRFKSPPLYIDLSASSVNLAPASFIRGLNHPNHIRRRSDLSSLANDDSSAPEFDCLKMDNVSAQDPLVGHARDRGWTGYYISAIGYRFTYKWRVLIALYCTGQDTLTISRYLNRDMH
ncbi:hypothetical protein BV25DRAFT_405700 [Artomyces pyxidatus]|uniref:Uncharacterized protein n=1 Tax=Artomyces pyxidatus TaxID=48021 RepID=A0ACB8T4J5_9AGAM|nr:hypothetical protein BV25DRAFT_405700 [Artomyces pyxidatus]